MRRKLTPAILVFSATIGITIAFQSKGWPLLLGTQRGDEKPTVLGTIREYASYTLVGEDELFARTEIAFVGEVTGFGPSLWNSDNNDSPASVQEWESTSSSLHHQVKLKVLKPILGANMGQVVNVTEAGPSPIQPKVKIGAGTFYAESEGDRLRIGSRGIFLISTRGEFQWTSASGKFMMKKVPAAFVAPLFQSYLPEKNGKYSYDDELVTPELVESKLRLYAPLREEVYRKINEHYRAMERQSS